MRLLALGDLDPAMIEIDGSQGEGGGQVLRTSLSVAALTGRAVRIGRVRAGRSKPGLAPQHLSVVRSLALICGAETEGAQLGSTEVTFTPAHMPRAGDYDFDVSEAAANGSAGSVTLLAQALLPVLALADGPSRLELSGGTHVRWSPSFEFFQNVYLPQLHALGIEVRSQLVTPGFYPVGQGKVELELTPGTSREWKPIQLEHRGELLEIAGSAVACNLPAHIPQRMTDRSRSLLADLSVNFRVQPQRLSGAGPGAALTLIARSEGAVAGFTAHGEQGKPSEEVAEEGCRRLQDYLEAGAPVDVHLADQLLLPLCMVQGTSIFRTERSSGHLRASAQLLSQLLPVRINLTPREGPTAEVKIESKGL